MFRYLALTWNESDPGATSAARLITDCLKRSSAEWQDGLITPGLAVFHADARPGSSGVYALPDGSGVILGKLFNHAADESTVLASISFDKEKLLIASSKGRHLIKRYWGRYVAFRRDRHARTTWVLRDPMGALPCFATEFRGVRLFFSCAEDCLALDLLRLSLDWDYLAAYVCYGRVLKTRSTGLKEVSEVQPGECWEIRDDGKTIKSLYWQPTEIARSNPIEDIGQAIEALRATTKMCVAAWASCYPKILHLLSGGLDSSIVLSCLRSAPTRPAVDCLTYFNSSSPAGDERRFAKAVAGNMGCSLTEVEERASDTNLEIIMQMARSANPWPMQYYATHSRSESGVAREKGVAAIFYGSGGDQIFFQGPVPLTAVDYAYHRGIRKGLFQVAAQVARETRLSFWSVLSSSVRNGWLQQPWNPAENCRQMSVVAPDLRQTVHPEKYLAHPWLAETKGIPWGKLEHIRMMSVSHDFYDPLGAPDGPEHVRPLVSQPLIELCLRIPTYVLAARGFDRVIARRAFAKELPREIVMRRTKGVISHYFHQLLHHNASFIRELMLDGLLVDKGLLDRNKVLEALNGRRASLGPEAAEIVVFHLGTEAWARRWTDGGQKQLLHTFVNPIERQRLSAA